jgi:hypothetical protein
MSATRARAVRWAGLALSGLVVAALTTACGSSGSSTNSPPGANAGSPGAASADVAEAQRLVAPYEKLPTTIGDMTPIGKPIPSGKVVAFMDAGTPAVHANLAPLTAAAAALGWTVRDINVGVTATSIQAGWNTVVRLKPDYIIDHTGNLPSTYARQCAQLAALNIPVFVDSVVRKDAAGFSCIKGITDDERQIGPLGTIVADYIISRSGGNARVLYLNVPQFGILIPQGEYLKAELSRLCASCTYSSIDFSASDIGTSAVATQIVGYLRAHPDINYIVPAFDPILSGVQSALQGAGISNISFVGTTPQAANAVAIAQGNSPEKASISYDQITGDWKMMDMVARYSVGLPVTVDETSPDNYFLLTTDNVSAWPGQPSAFPWPTVADYQAKYKALWGVK